MVGKISAHPHTFVVHAVHKMNLPFSNLPEYTLFVLPNICITVMFLIFLDFIVVPREIEENAYEKFWEANKVYCVL